ncbi:MAG: FG-GAP-like repeat-containing protein, partial [Lentisphaerae bacterium]|nr:FG-GAP-like repeat-containing protein [Lentisphaerota bacterium]
LQNMTAGTAFNLWNGGGEPRQSMRFQVTTDAAWLSFSPATGRVQNDATSIEVLFDAGSMAPGTYSGNVQVDAWDESDGQRATGAPLLLPAVFTVLNRTPRNFEPPEVRGPAYMGQIISAWPGIWNNMDRLQFEFSWESAATPGGARSVVRGWSSDATYRVRQADRGRYLRVVVRAIDPTPVPLSSEAASRFVDSRFRAVPDDFDGDGVSDLWFFNPSDGYWRAALSGGVADKVLFGAAGMVPVPGDYDGNGYLDLGLYDPASGFWYVMLLPQWQYLSGHFGGGGMTAVPDDYNGDGTTDLGVYYPKDGRWYIYYINEGRVQTFNLGGPGKVPVPADYDGDGQSDLAVYRISDGLWQGISSRNGAAWSEVLGGAGAWPTPGDYDGDGQADLAVYYRRGNLWQILNSSDGTLRREQFGVSHGGAIPLPGYFEYAGSFDPAHAQLAGDFIIWCVRRASETKYFSYRGQSYQVSTDQWRIDW